MTDATRIRAMELRMKADEVEEHDQTFEVLTALAEADPDMNAEAREGLALLAALTTPGESPEEIALRGAIEEERSKREVRAVMRSAYIEHLTSPGCDCGQTLGRWEFCDRAREEGFR